MVEDGTTSQGKPTSSGTFRFLAFANDQEDAEKEATLKEAVEKIELAIAKEKAISELVDYKPPKEEIDETKSLYERLEEQRNKKKEALDEEKKLSNLITTLDEDDADYLNEIAKAKREEELRKRLQIHDALEAKKKLNEQKLIDEEKRRRESLLGLGNRPTTSNSKQTKQSRLSSLVKRAKMASKEDPPKNTSEIKQDDASTKCICPKDSTKTLGVLPSMPIQLRHPEADRSEESDSSWSEEETLGRRLVPRISRHKRIHKNDR